MHGCWLECVTWTQWTVTEPCLSLIECECGRTIVRMDPSTCWYQLPNESSAVQPSVGGGGVVADNSSVSTTIGQTDPSLSLGYAVSDYILLWFGLAVCTPLSPGSQSVKHGTGHSLARSLHPNHALTHDPTFPECRLACILSSRVDSWPRIVSKNARKGTN